MCVGPSECDDHDVCTVDACQGTCVNTRLHDTVQTPVAPVFLPPVSLTFPTSARAPLRLASDGEQVVVFLDGTTTAKRVFSDGGTATAIFPAPNGFLAWNGAHFLYVWSTGPDVSMRSTIQARAYDRGFNTLADAELASSQPAPLAATGLAAVGADFVVLSKTDRRVVTRLSDGGLFTRLEAGLGGQGLAATPDDGLLVWDAVPGTATKTFIDADGGSFVEYPHRDGGTQLLEYASFATGTGSALMFFDLNFQGPVFSAGHYVRPMGADHRFSANHRILGVGGNRQSATEHSAFDGANYLVAIESQNRFALFKLTPQGTVFADDAGLGSGIETVAVRSIVPGLSAVAMKRDAGVVVRPVITCP